MFFSSLVFLESDSNKDYKWHLADRSCNFLSIFISLATYLLKRLSCLSCRISYIWDFAACVLVVVFNIFLHPLYCSVNW